MTNTGGSNGATMRFAPEGDHGANAGLKAARDFLEPVKGVLSNILPFFNLANSLTALRKIPLDNLFRFVDSRGCLRYSRDARSRNSMAPRTERSGCVSLYS